MVEARLGVAPSADITSVMPAKKVARKGADQCKKQTEYQASSEVKSVSA